MSIWKRFAASLLCLVLVLAVMPVPQAAAAKIMPETVAEAVPEVVSETLTSDADERPIFRAYGVNSIYRDVYTTRHESHRSDAEIRNSLANATIYNSLSEAAAYVRQQMVARNGEFSVGFYYSNIYEENLYYKLLQSAVTHTGNPVEGDYLLYQFGAFNVNWSYGSNYITYNYSMEYYTTAAQEREMDTAVANLLTSLDLTYLDNYQKVCKIYDWICDNIVYDHYNNQYNPGTYMLQYTGYAGLINGTCVCQGYAGLFYRLALECGVDARVIAGDGGGPHAWNIVRMGRYYYNLDATWDAGSYYRGYDYFLRSMANFTDHIRQQQYSYWYENGVECRYNYMDYASDAFSQQYPMGPTDYTYSASDFVVITGHPNSKTVAEGANAQFGVVASGTGLTYQWQYKTASGTVWNNTTLTGAKTSLLTVPATAARNGCKYRCVVRDAAGNVAYSNPATLTVK